MKVILNDYIEHLGERGDSVSVKPGYANNYLVPKGLAYPDTPGNRRRFEQEQKKWEEIDLERRSAGEKLAAELEGTKLAFERRAGEKDVLFGSVSAADIHRALQDRGFDLDRKRIVFEHPIKELGVFEVVVQIHRDISVTIPITVVRPGEDPEAVKAEFEAEGRLEISDAELAATAEAKSDVGTVTPPEGGAAETGVRSETGPVAD